MVIEIAAVHFGPVLHQFSLTRVSWSPRESQQLRRHRRAESRAAHRDPRKIPRKRVIVMPRRTRNTVLVALVTLACVASSSLIVSTPALGAPQPKTTTTTLSSSGSPSEPGSLVTFTATVLRPGGGTADPTSGTVAFYDDTDLLGTATVDGTHQASFSTSALATGSHPITATFEGDADFATSTSLVLEQVVTSTTTTTSVASSLNPSEFEQPVSLTAVVSADAGTPGGSVAFMDGADPIPACDAQPLVAGVATCLTASLTIGEHSVTAVYSGDLFFTPSTSAPLVQTVTKLATLVALSSDTPTSTFGEAVTFTAVVSAPSGSAPTTGTVSFYDGAELIATSPLNISAVAAVSVTTLSAGSHEITATFEGTATYEPSTSILLGHTVVKANTTTSLTSTSNPSPFGTVVTFTATVTPDPGAGTVQFVVDGVDFGIPVPVTGGVAVSEPAAGLAVGERTVEAIFSGTANYNGSSTTLAQTVDKALTSTSLEVSNNPSVYGDEVTFIAVVTPDPADGTVQFSADGTSIPGCAAASINAGVATCATASLGAGQHAVTADFSGSAQYTASAAPPLDQVVNTAGTTTVLNADTNPSAYGDAVEFTATVTGVTGGEVPTGLVQFSVDGVPVGDPVAVAAGSASLIVDDLTAGQHNVEADYMGSTNYDTSTDQHVQTVEKAPSSVVLKVTPTKPKSGEPFTLTATVTGTTNGTTPTGQIQFLLDGKTRGNPKTLSNGSVSLKLAGTSAGPHKARANFLGNASYVGSFATASVAVLASPTSPNYRSGYWMVGLDGAVFAFGDVSDLGEITATDVTDIEPSSTGKGYWIVTHSGNVSEFGDAKNYGDARALLNIGERVVSISATPSGNGYWLFTDRGRAFPFGAAKFFGDMAGVQLNGPVLESVATPSGKGYYMVAYDGGVFSFGDARFYGSMGSTPLNAPVVGLVPDPDNVGYWLVASDGGVFAFDAAFKGSMGGTPLNRPVIGMVGYGDGYLMVGEDGGIFNFSTEPFRGSLGSRPHSAPIVSVAAYAGP